MLERALSAFAFIVLCAFLAVLVMRLGRLDIALVIAACVLLCGYDLFLHGRFGRRKQASR